MTNEILTILLRLVLVSSLAMIVVLFLRHPVRHAFGAAVSYALWLLIPASMLAILLPRPASLPMIVVEQGQPIFEALAGGSAFIETCFDASESLLLIWLTGALLSLGLTLTLQWRMLCRLGPLEKRADGSWQSRDNTFGPMLIGILRPRIIVPANFYQHYAAQEQELIIAHERVHHRRGDAQINVIVVLLRCLQWFNPIAHLAAQSFRKDQEFACDAGVIHQFPNARRSYADAMLKTQLIDSGLPIGCFWQSSHPIKERIVMFKKPLPSRLKKILGSSVLFATVLATSCLVWAAQANDVEASYAKMNPPAFPADLDDKFVKGAVYLKVEINDDGEPILVDVDHVGNDSLTEEQIASISAAAIESVKTWKFNPAMKDGVAVGSSMIVPISFRNGPVPNSESPTSKGASGKQN